MVLMFWKPDANVYSWNTVIAVNWPADTSTCQIDRNHNAFEKSEPHGLFTNGAVCAYPTHRTPAVCLADRLAAWLRCQHRAVARELL